MTVLTLSLTLTLTCNLNQVSVHGSHNANVMWMRPGAAFMEVNPRKFYYASYHDLATVAGLLFLQSRRNEIALAADSPLKPKVNPNPNRNPNPNQLKPKARSFER